MNCQDVQDHLYGCDAPGGPVPADVEAHLALCPACSQIRHRLVRLEQAVRAMPADAAQAAERQRPVAARPGRVLAWSMRAAAVLLVGLGVWAWVHWRSNMPSTTEQASDSTQPASDPEVIDQLVAWNVDLAERSTPDERAQTFQKEQHKLRSKVARAKLSAAERRLADQLLANGEWLAQHDDSLGEAERFSVIAQGLVDHMDFAARQGKADRLDRLSGVYCTVVDRGISRKLKTLRHSALKADEQQRIEQIVRDDQKLHRKLQDLLDRSPHASRKQVQRALKSSESVWH